MKNLVTILSFEFLMPKLSGSYLQKHKKWLWKNGSVIKEALNLVLFCRNWVLKPAHTHQISETTETSNIKVKTIAVISLISGNRAIKRCWILLASSYTCPQVSWQFCKSISPEYSLIFSCFQAFFPCIQVTKSI